MADEILYQYIVENISRREAILVLAKGEKSLVTPSRYLHIGWCIIDPKKIEKTLPALNETGVSKITFVRCQRSQSNYRLDLGRIESILLNSSQQCGRSELMNIEIVDSLREFVSLYPDAYMLNFSDNALSREMDIDTVVVGCEGGFDDSERAMFAKEQIVGLDTPMILRSETAVVAVASNLLL